MDRYCGEDKHWEFKGLGLDGKREDVQREVDGAAGVYDGYCGLVLGTGAWEGGGEVWSGTSMSPTGTENGSIATEGSGA